MALLEFLMIGFVSVVNLKIFSHFLLKVVNEITSGRNQRNLY